MLCAELPPDHLVLSGLRHHTGTVHSALLGGSTVLGHLVGPGGDLIVGRGR